MEVGPEARVPLEEEPEGYAPSVAQRFAFYQRAGGVLTPVLTTVFAFFMGGVVVLATGHNPWRTYQAIFQGAGLNWFFHFGSYHIDLPFTNHHVWFWWDTDTAGNTTYNLTQTLATTTPLILTGLAVAFAFRCGLFNIGGQGQYIAGAIVGVWVGTSFPSMGHVPHVLLAILLASLVGATWAAFAGILKAAIGANEVITTIRRNWVAYWAGIYAFGRGGPLQSQTEKSIPVSSEIHASAKLPVFWGHAQEGVHVVLEILGRQYELGVADVQVSNIGFIGIAVALLGRNTAVGIGLAALLFGGLTTGTSTRSLDPNIFPPELADNLALMIQALVLLFVGANLLILYLWQARRKLRLSRRRTAAMEEG